MLVNIPTNFNQNIGLLTVMHGWTVLFSYMDIENMIDLNFPSIWSYRFCVIFVEGAVYVIIFIGTTFLERERPYCKEILKPGFPVLGKSTTCIRSYRSFSSMDWGVVSVLTTMHQASRG